MLINLLGGDGCGKTTQTEVICKWVESEFGLNSRTMAKRDIFDPDRVPECDFFRITYPELAHEYLPIMKGESRALWLIYMNAVLIRRFPPRPGEVVVHDGFWQKHYATEAAMGVDRSWLLDVCKMFPEPDMTVMLDLDPRVIVSRGHKHHPYESGCDFECGDASFIAHQDKVRSLLLDLSRQRNYPIVDADQPVDCLTRELQNLLTPKLQAEAETVKGRLKHA